MTITISEVLARRSDLSTFVVHFTRATDDGMTARSNLRSILEGRVIEARSPFGPAADAVKSKSDRQSQKCVSFSETPLEHVYCLTGRIAKRQVHLSKYGFWTQAGWLSS